MCRKLIYVVSFILVLALVGSATAALPQGWQSQDIDTTGGSAAESDGTWAISADGADIWGNSDQFHYVYRELTGDATIEARVVDNGEGSNAWAKGGVMIRQSLDADSINVSGFITGGSGDGGTFQWRSVQGDSSSSNRTLTGIAPPYYVRLVREGNTFTVFMSADGVEWAQQGEPPATIEMTDPVLIGLAVTSHQDGEVRTFTFDNVSTGLTKAAKRPEPADGAMHADTWANLRWTPGATAVSHDVYFSDNFDNVIDRAPEAFQVNQSSTVFVAGFPGFPYPDGLVPGTTYYWVVDELEADGTTKYEGNVWSFTIPPKTAYAPDPVDGAEQVDQDADLNWTAGFGAKLHYVYFGDNFDDVNNATFGMPLGSTSYDPGILKLAKTYYWRVDEFDIINTYKGDVWSFTTHGAVGNPDPANGAVDVKQTQIITFSPSVFAVSHELYFGTDKDTVKNADTGSPEYKGTKALGAESYDPGKLEMDATYYWRIDEVNNVNPDSPWLGILWSFTTAGFLIVDDFEDYDSGDNQIWYTWKDGLGYAAYGNEPAYPGNGTGSAVGDENTASFTEETIVHGGGQSMPFFYDNNQQGKLRYSEAEMTLSYPRDWTEDGVGVLSLWFYGVASNAAEPLYVALNGNAVVTHNNPNATQIETWTEWPIDLQAFADQGVNLANVNTIAIGLGNKKNPAAGGSGIIYIDDIRLYRLAP